MKAADDRVGACDGLGAVLVRCWLSGVRFDNEDACGVEDTAYVPSVGNAWGGRAGVG
jgi:hypothetical protein